MNRMGRQTGNEEKKGGLSNQGREGEERDYKTNVGRQGIVGGGREGRREEGCYVYERALLSHASIGGRGVGSWEGGQPNFGWG